MPSEGALAVNEDWGRRLRAARRAYEDRHDTRLSYTEIGRRVGLRLGRKPYSSPSARAWFIEGQEPESFAVAAAIAFVLEVDPGGLAFPASEPASPPQGLHGEPRPADVGGARKRNQAKRNAAKQAVAGDRPGPTRPPKPR